jgi:hypothetical protein
VHEGGYILPPTGPNSSVLNSTKCGLKLSADAWPISATKKWRYHSACTFRSSEQVYVLDTLVLDTWCLMFDASVLDTSPEEAQLCNAAADLPSRRFVAACIFIYSRARFEGIKVWPHSRTPSGLLSS